MPPESRTRSPFEPLSPDPHWLDEERADRIIALLSEYTEKLSEGYSELEKRRYRTFMVSSGPIVLGLASIVLGASSTVGIEELTISPYLTVVLYIVGLFSTLFAFRVFRSERQRQIETITRLSSLTRRLEPVMRWALEMHQRGERDEVRRLELNLRIAEARSYTKTFERLPGSDEALRT